MAKATNDMLEGLAELDSPAKINEWLSGRPDRLAWFMKQFGLDGSKKPIRDTDVSATVEAELPIPGEPIFASMQADNSREAFRLAHATKENTNTPVFIKHVQTRVISWYEDQNGNTALYEGLPVPAKLAPVYKRENFYRVDGSRPRIRDEYWTDSRGYVLPEVEQDRLSFKYEHGSAGIAREDRAPEYEPTFFQPGEHAKWWHRRSSVIGTDPSREATDKNAIIRIAIERVELRMARKLQSEDLARRKEDDTPAPSVDPLVETPPEPTKLYKSRQDLVDRKVQIRLDRSWQIMTGERAELEAEIQSLREKRLSLNKELAQYKLKRKVARQMFKEAKASGLGGYVFEDAGPSPEHGDGCLSPYWELKRELNAECEFRQEEINDLDARLGALQKRLI